MSKQQSNNASSYINCGLRSFNFQKKILSKPKCEHPNIFPLQLLDSVKESDEITPIYFCTSLFQWFELAYPLMPRLPAIVLFEVNTHL